VTGREGFIYNMDYGISDQCDRIPNLCFIIDRHPLLLHVISMAKGNHLLPKGASQPEIMPLPPGNGAQVNNSHFIKNQALAMQQPHQHNTIHIVSRSFRQSNSSHLVIYSAVQDRISPQDPPGNK